MRDLWHLRTRLHAALGTGLLLAACGPAPQPQPVAVAPTKAGAKPPAPEVVAEPRVLEPLPELPPAPNYPERTGQDPFDPDGMEEEGCPNGDWCASPAAAEKFKAVNAEVELGCPTRLMGKPDSGVSATDKTYKGLSMNPMMMGRLRKIATDDQRKASGDQNVCCYHWFDYCSGRPLLEGEDAVVAQAMPGRSWLGEHVPEDMAGEPPAELRPLLATEWLQDAQFEHASVASFARAALELMAVGAPAELLAGCAQAGLDEVRHAQACFALAAAYGEAMRPGPLPPPAPRAGGLVALACDTFREGCVGETIAALTAMRAARGCRAPAASAALATIAEDETRHAELAWATLAWAVRTGGREVAEAVRALADELRTEALADSEHAPEAADLSAWGRLGASARADARRDAWTGVLGETLALVLAAAPADELAPRDIVCGESARDPMI
jgi:hypothetical protein